MFANRGLLKDHSSIWSGLLQVVDLLVVGLSGVVAGELYLGSGVVFAQGYPQLIAVALLLSVIIFNKFGFYAAWRNSSLAKELRTVFTGWATVQIGAIDYGSVSDLVISSYFDFGGV